MKRLMIAVFTLAILIACSKNESRNSEEPLLYGKWQMGPGNGDTIEFLHNNGRNILRFYDARFISGIYAEREYHFIKGKLSIQMYPSESFTPVTTFNWQQGANTFSIISNEFYPMLSSTTTLIYNKIP